MVLGALFVALLLMNMLFFQCFLLILSSPVVYGNSSVFVASSIQKSPNYDVQESKYSSIWDSFVSGFSASFYVIIISELGDKTFFIAAIMSMQHPRLLVYAGAMMALITMTILSALLGYATTIIPRAYTFYASGVLFMLFGLKMLYEAYTMSANSAQEEYDEVNIKLSQSKMADEEMGSAVPNENLVCFKKFCLAFKKVFTPVFAEAFILTFLAEWGDRSQITTIVLAATKSASGVIIGGVSGHFICTGIAVLMGRFVAQRIPIQWITFIGGITFLLFALSIFVGNPDSNS